MANQDIHIAEQRWLVDSIQEDPGQTLQVSVPQTTTRRIIVDRSLIMRPPSHIPEPTFGSLVSIAPFQDGVFHYPATLNPEIAKAAFRVAGFNLVYSREARKIIDEHRAVVFEYDAGYVWVKSQKNDDLKELLDDATLKTYLIWSPYYDSYRLRQTGSASLVRKLLEEQGIDVTFKGFPQTTLDLPRLQTPKTVNVTLYPFQKKAVDFVMRNDGRVCIFDEMGLGKTVSATAALIELVKARKASRAMVVAPNAVLEQWRDEMTEKFGLHPTLVTSKRQLKERTLLYEEPLVIINYELLRTDVELILKKAFDTLILDEVTRVKNWDTQTSEAVKRLLVRNVIALTGTPLENHIGELYNIVSIVQPGYFGRYHEDFLARYTIRSLGGPGWQSSHPSANPSTLGELRARLAKVSIRRTKSEVLKQLPSLTMEYVYTEPARNQKMIYDILQASLGETLIEEYSFGLSEEGGPNPFTANRIRLYTLLREACADISMIAGYLRRKQRENTKDAQLLRQSPVFGRLMRILSKLEPENAKLVELKQLVQDLVEQGHKIVIFSQFVPVVKLVQDELESDGITCLPYHGQLTNEERSFNVKTFTTHPDVAVLASTDAGQFGLNLQAADAVINYDLPWNPARLQQRIARIHRIGQVNKVLAVNFVVKGTIEEHVRDVLEKKKKVFKDVTVSELTETEDFGLDELKDIFGFDMKRLAEKVRQRYGIRVETPLKRR